MLFQMQYDGMMSQYQSLPVLEDSDHARNDHHRLDDDDELYGISTLALRSSSKSQPPSSDFSQKGSEEESDENGAGAPDMDVQREVSNAPDRHQVHKSFVHGRPSDADPQPAYSYRLHVSHPSTIATAIALMLVGMMAMGISIFYLVNYPDEDIQQVTWTILSSTISLFCAVLIFSALKCVIEIFLGERVGLHSHSMKPDWTLVVSSSVHFIIMFVLFQALVVAYREKNFSLIAWAEIGGHITAFAAIEAFGNLMHYSFSANWLQGFFLVGSVFLVLWGLSSLAQYVRVGLQPESKEQQIVFHEKCDAAGRESLSLVVGFLVSLLVRQMITGHLPPIHGSPRHKTQMQIWQLFGCSTAFIITLVALTYLTRDRLESSKGLSNNWGFLSWGLAQSTLSMSAGWSLLSWGQWLFWSSIGESMGEADKMEARMIMAIAFSALVFSSIFIFDFIADHIAIQAGMRALISTMALLLGLAWEAVFTLAIESICDHYIEHPAQYIYCELGLTFCLCGVVLPAWVMYFIPRAEEGLFLLEEEMQAS